jgi:hypothetical protein
MTMPIETVESECERHIVSNSTLDTVRGIVPTAKVGDVLISGACYQDMLLRR